MELRPKHFLQIAQGNFPSTVTFPTFSQLIIIFVFLTLQSPIPQNGQTHAKNCLSAFDHFVGLALKGLTFIFNPFDSNASFPDSRLLFGVLKRFTK